MKVTADLRLVRYCASVAAGRTRLLVAYFVTTQVALSYLGLAVARRFRRPEAIERLTRAKHRTNARRIEAAILRLRGLFIKVGQLISIMANFLPDAFREELRAPAGSGAAAPLPRHRGAPARGVRRPRPDRGVRRVLARAGRVGVDRPGAPGPPAHGEQVAVKVQYPDIEEIVRTDLRALRRIFDLLRWFMPDYGFDTIYREIREMVLAELDYRREAAAIEKIAANFARAQDDAATSASRGSSPSFRPRAC